MRLRGHISMRALPQVNYLSFKIITIVIKQAKLQPYTGKFVYTRHKTL